MGTLAEKWLEEVEQKGFQGIFREAFQKGFREGFREGFEKGRQEVSRKFVRNMLKAEMDVEQISRIAELSVAEVKKLGRR